MVRMTNKEQTHDLLSLREVAWVFFAFAVALKSFERLPLGCFDSSFLFCVSGSLR
jgi:hypothetical protein